MQHTSAFQLPIVEVRVHDLHGKLGIILARCDLLETHSQLGEEAQADLGAIRRAAESLIVPGHAKPHGD